MKYLIPILFLLCMSCAGTTIVPEQFKQTGDLIDKGAAFIDNNTPEDSELKLHTATLSRLAETHSSVELGKPQEALSLAWATDAAETQIVAIEENKDLFLNPWLVCLVLFAGRALLKSTGLYIPEKSLLIFGHVAKAFITEKLFKKDRKES